MVFVEDDPQTVLKFELFDWRVWNLKSFLHEVVCSQLRWIRVTIKNNLYDWNVKSLPRQSAINKDAGVRTESGSDRIPNARLRS